MSLCSLSVQLLSSSLPSFSPFYSKQVAAAWNLTCINYTAVCIKAAFPGMTHLTENVKARYRIVLHTCQKWDFILSRRTADRYLTTICLLQGFTYTKTELYQMNIILSSPRRWCFHLSVCPFVRNIIWKLLNRCWSFLWKIRYYPRNKVLHFGQDGRMGW